MKEGVTSLQYIGNIKTMNATMSEALAQCNTQNLVCFPQEITLTALSRCNYRCPMCYQASYDAELDWAVVEKIEPLLPFAKTLQIFGGEPFLYERIIDLYRMAHKHDCFISTISNGSLLTEDMCAEIVRYKVGCIKFSIDAGTAATYKRIRGGDFAKVMGGIERIAKLKRSKRTPFPAMDFNFLAMRQNLPELPRLLRIAADLGIREVNVFYPGFYKVALAEDCLFFEQERSDELMLAAKDIAGRLGVHLNAPTLFRDAPEPGFSEIISDKPSCLDPWTKLIVNVDGGMALCCSGPTNIGNLAQGDFEPMWNGKQAAQFRRTVNTPKAPDFCRNCNIRQGSPREPGFHFKTPELLARYSKARPV
jgi:radical SAM protein with 4Fe4S-binding SPASM domain